MRHTLLYIACLFVLALPSAAQDSVRTYSVEDVPNVRLTDRSQYVSDPAAILSATTKAAINAVLDSLEQSTGIETAVVMLPSIGEEEPFNFALSLFRQWGIGKKKSDNGLLILFVGDQRRVQFTTGYGVEGSLPDITCKRIQTKYMLPSFRKGDYDTGMRLGVQAVSAALQGSMEAENESDGDLSIWNYAFLIAAVVFFAVLPIYLNRQQKRCPKCGKRTLRKIATTSFKNKYGHTIRRDTFICDSCGHTTNRDDDLTRHRNNANTLTNAMIIGSMFGRGRGGAGFGGGSFGGRFGGGSSGGGGAGSGW